MRKATFIKFWRIILGMATEMAMTAFIIASALGIAWLISGGWQ